ncbi:MAG: D-alanine--D-alanine ligase [Deltaproteobacteria bacterium]|nr:D-alanine--D-alanine ligase [Deltaproteobacteria bacterium]
MATKQSKIGVLLGGISKEREVSLRTGAAVANALKNKGFSVISIDCGNDFVAQIAKSGIDVAFIALHGAFGEDGCVQGVLESLRIPYTGSGVLASALAMDKAVLNSFLRGPEILMPEEEVFSAETDSIDQFLRKKRNFPLFVKPSREGSTINATIVRDQKKLKEGIEQALQSDSKILVQEFIEGKEITVSILNGRVLPSIEIVPKSGFYDYTSKYTKGMTEYILPANVSKKTEQEMNRVSLKVWEMIDCSGIARVDFIVSKGEEKPYFLEINTMPGMTETSLVPKAAAKEGISFENLCEQILETASLQVMGGNS